MYTSVTTGHTAREIRSTRRIGFDGESRTVRVQPSRGTARRTAISSQLGYR